MGQNIARSGRQKLRRHVIDSARQRRCIGGAVAQRVQDLGAALAAMEAQLGNAGGGIIDRRAMRGQKTARV